MIFVVLVESYRKNGTWMHRHHRPGLPVPSLTKHTVNWREQFKKNKVKNLPLYLTEAWVFCLNFFIPTATVNWITRKSDHEPGNERVLQEYPHHFPGKILYGHQLKSTRTSMAVSSCLLAVSRSERMLDISSRSRVFSAWDSSHSWQKRENVKNKLLNARYKCLNVV